VSCTQAPDRAARQAPVPRPQSGGPVLPLDGPRPGAQGLGWKKVPNPNPGPPQQIWIKARAEALQPLTPHEARHCAASYMIAAGMDWKKITEFIGHSDVRTTYNRYGKLESR
jgi:integrase